MPYRTLDPVKIEKTAMALETRIAERFPESGLRKVAVEVSSLSAEAAGRIAELVRPVWWLRILIVAVIAMGAALFAFVGTFLSFERIGGGPFDAIQGIESAANTAILAGIGFVALVRLEERLKRKRVLDGLHALRSVIHIIDMHQLTKDPATLQTTFRPTKSSPKRTLTREELARYLDYCSELLSITGKLAALHAQAINDAVVVEAVNDIEALATNLSRKIWQKIMLIDIWHGERPAVSPAPRIRRRPKKSEPATA